MEIKKAASHPDVPRPSNDELIALARKVIDAIEACGASPALTNAVCLAADLHTYLRKPSIYNVLYVEAALISANHAKWEKETVLACDDVSYDTFAAGWKSAVRLMAF